MGLHPGLADGHYFLANAGSPHEIGDGSGNGFPAGVSHVGGSQVKQEGQVDAVVVVIADKEAPLVGTYGIIEHFSILSDIPESLVDGSPEAKGFGIVRGSRL